MANPLEKVIAAISPHWAFRRAGYRMALREYEAAKSSRHRSIRRDRGSGDAVVGRAGDKLRIQARYLDENHDLVVGVLDTLVNRTIGAGLWPEPHVRTRDGDLHADFNRRVYELFQEWARKPEVTGELDWPGMQRLMGLTWFRDGEGLAQHLEGIMGTLDHQTIVPYSLEMIEPDLLPFDLNDEARGIVQGVERNAWGRPRAYHLLKGHPGDLAIRLHMDTKRVEAERIIHLKRVRRIGQARGVSILAAVLIRLDDIRDYEDSERIAAKVAAALTGYIKKAGEFSPPDPASAADKPREVMFKPGTFWDGARLGEELELFQSNRPNNNLEAYRNGQLRAVAAGTGTGFSSIAKNYNGTYSAQRQELVEMTPAYRALTGYFVGQFGLPVWRRFVRMAILSGALSVPADVDRESLDAAIFQPPSLPWVDPVKEVTAEERQVAAGFKSRSQVIRERGQNPRDVEDQIDRERKLARERGLTFSTDARTGKEKPKKKDRKKKK